MTRSGVAAVAVALIALAGCNGDGDGEPEQEVREVVRGFAKANTDSDGKAFCALVTREFRERITGATGDKVDGQCVRQIDTASGTDIRVITIGLPKIDGDRATVTAELEFAGQRQNRVFELEREDGKFRLAGG